MVTKFRRYWQIADILFKYGLGSIHQRLFPRTYRLRRCKECPVETVSSTYERTRLAIEELGPTAVKFGQILSTRQDMLPPGLITELKKLQDNVAPLPFSEIEKAIASALPDYAEKFISIEKTPLASASLAQVHRATLNDGTQVVLKVQRPGIREIVETDIVILHAFAERVVRYYPQYRVYNPQGIIADFADQIRKELDFVRDGRNADRLRFNMQDREKIRVPKIFWDYSSPTLLVMEYVEGVRVDHVDEIRSYGVDPKEIANLGFDAYMQQIFEDGFYHGDPHPGNLLVSRDGALTFLDFGLIGVIYPERRNAFIEFLYGMVDQDPDLMVDALERMGITIAEKDRDQLREEIYVVMLDSEGESISQYSFKGMAEGLTNILRKYQIAMPQNLILMLKVIVMVLDVGVTLDPKFNFMEKADPYFSRLSRKDLLLNQIFSRAGRSIFESVDAIIETPGNLNRMLRRFSSGAVRIDLEGTDLLLLQQSLDQTSDKILVGMIVAGIVVGSSLVLTVANVNIPPFVFYLAIFAYVAAIVIGLYAMWHAMRTGRR
ncbi:MAG: ABC1 kinase family protein [Methanomicrobiales archaeon]